MGGCHTWAGWENSMRSRRGSGTKKPGKASPWKFLALFAQTVPGERKEAACYPSNKATSCLRLVPSSASWEQDGTQVLENLRRIYQEMDWGRYSLKLPELGLFIFQVSVVWVAENNPAWQKQRIGTNRKDQPPRDFCKKTLTGLTALKFKFYDEGG